MASSSIKRVGSTWACHAPWTWSARRAIRATLVACQTRRMSGSSGGREKLSCPLASESRAGITFSVTSN
eukprot:4507364-Pyramimonas_sp.AAC.1